MRRSRSLAAGALLLACYVGLSFVNATGGYLGTDTGGKVATLEVMTRGPGLRLDPDLGYWAEEWDPDGSLYPIYFTSRIGDRWVNVTTFPMLFAAAPLYDLGGYRLALILPMLGSVAAAFAASALCARLGGRRWLAFWVVGLASPMTIYALDFWEHSVGVALMAWGVLVVWDMVAALTGDGGNVGRWLWRAAVGGAVFGAAATMRTEALVYTAATAVVAAVAVLAAAGVRRSSSRPQVPASAMPLRVAAARVAVAAVAALVAFIVVVGANEALERSVLDRGLRGSRAAATASVAGDAPTDRFTEAAFTTIASEGSARGVLAGGAAVLLFAYALLRRRADPRFARALAAGATALVAVRFAFGFGFVPGMFVAWPIAIVGLVTGRRAFPWAVALVALPVVLATQFRGGASPQWAGRYILTTGLLLAVCGIAAIDRLPNRLRQGVLAVAAVVTAFGVGWMSVRTHDIARTIAAIERSPEPIIVSTVEHLAREGGATSRDPRWLTTSDEPGVAEAAEVVRAAGETRFLLVEFDHEAPPASGDRLAGWSPVGARRVELFEGVDLRLTSWQALTSS